MSIGQLILVSAPSGAGKTSILRAALEQDQSLSVAVSHTTRDKRGNEQDGVNYYFVEPDAFQNMVDGDEFLEYADVFDRRYGTSKAEVERLRSTGQDVVLEIDWQGADQIRASVPDAASIFILPPSHEILRERLHSRGEDSPQSMQRRQAEAQLEISQAPKYQYIIVNDNFDQAVAELLAVCRTLRLRANAQITNNPQVKAILSES